MPNLHKRNADFYIINAAKAVVMMIIIIFIIIIIITIAILREQVKSDCHQHKLTLESE